VAMVRDSRASAFVLLGSVLCVYALSLRGGYLNWDDPWLVAQNRFFLHPTLGGLWQIWTDCSATVRYDLGAEYLPVRDTSLWLEAVLHRPNPALSRVIQLSLYGAALLRLRSFLRTSTGNSQVAEVAIWFFALHPAHVEVVAWLSARKDVLALLFSGAALDLYSRRPRRVATVVLLCALASLSKASSIVSPELLLVGDLMLRRKPNWATIGVSIAVVTAVGVVQLRVGSALGMLTGFAGGNRTSAFFTEGTVLLRYLQLSAWPQGLSLIHDMQPEGSWTWHATLGFGAWVGWLGAALWARQRRLIAAWLLFTIPLLPTVNALIPIQNLLADRYLCLSLIGPALLFGELCVNLRGALRSAVLSCMLLGLGAVSAYRARLFTSSVPVLEEAVLHSPDSRRAAFQLGKAYEEVGRADDAIRAYRDTLQRTAGVEEAAIRASIALTRLEEAQGDRSGALRELEAALRRWPTDERLRRRQRRLAPLSETSERDPRDTRP